MRTITIVNQKGGCGKTTTAINLASVLGMQGRSVLLVDMDPQSHCAAGLGIPDQRVDMDVGDAMLYVGRRPLDQARLVWRAGHNLCLVPSRMRLAGLEATRGGLSEMPDKERRLSLVLNELAPNFDIAIIDCGPSIGLLTYNALSAADFVMIPVETSFFSLQGATRQVNTVKTMARRLGVTLPVWILPTIHDETSAVAGDLLDELHRRFKDRVVPAVIRRDSKLREAASYGQTIHDYAPASPGADDYRRLAEWSQTRLSLPILNEPASEWADEPVAEQPYSMDQQLDPASVSGSDDSGHGSTDGPGDQLGDGMGEPSPVVTLTNPASTLAALGGVSARAELKPVSRAEDMARRAQAFMTKRVADEKALAAQNLPTEHASNHPRQEVPMRSVAPFAQSSPTTTATLFSSSKESARVAPTSSPTPSSTRLYGVRVTPQGVLFVQPLNLTGSAAVAGSFNGWSATAHVMRKNTTLNVFELLVKLPPGKYAYRLVQDNHWSADPYNDQSEMNTFNEPDSWFVVPG